MKEKVENYQEIGNIRFKKDNLQWWISLSDLVALLPKSIEFNLDKWLGDKEGLENVITTDGETVWGVYLAAIELARLMAVEVGKITSGTNEAFQKLPVWIMHQMRRPDQ